MRKQGGQYGGDSGGAGGGGNHHSYGGATGSMHHHHQSSSKSGYYAGRSQERQTLGDKEGQNQWRWERDGQQSKLNQTAISPTTNFVEGQGRGGSRSYYQGRRPDNWIPLDKQDVVDPRSHPHQVDMNIGNDDNQRQTFESLEQRFLDDIIKLSKEQTDAEDAENARHRERINVTNAQYQERLAALRAQHATRRDEFLRRESQARQHQYRQIITMQQFPNSSSVGPTDPRGYNAGTAPTGEQPHRAYNSDQYDSYRERDRFPGNNAKDHGFESKVPYPRGRAGGYDTGSRYY